MKRSSGILPYKFEDGKLLVYLERPGGPFWSGKNRWSVCKGEHRKGESSLEAAVREFREESGFDINGDECIYIGSYKQKSNKLVTMYIVNQDLDVTKMTSNTFVREFPHGSGIMKEFPEMEEGKWFLVDEARKVIFDGQKRMLDKLINML